MRLRISHVGIAHQALERWIEAEGVKHSHAVYFFWVVLWIQVMKHPRHLLRGGARLALEMIVCGHGEQVV
jgi:hypothetical protein